MDQTDSLEDWVAIKHEPFAVSITPSKLQFLVCWNSVEGKVAITCREHSRVVGDTQSEGHSGIFNFHELRGIHEQLCLIRPSLGPFLPELPYEPRGVWSFLYPPAELSEGDELFSALAKYLQIALDVCGKGLLIETLFEENSKEDYFESLAELKRRRFEDDVLNAEDELKNVQFMRQEAINMLDMCELYQQEDTAMFKLNVAVAQMYNYQLQPFLDMREVAYNKVNACYKWLFD